MVAFKVKFECTNCGLKFERAFNKGVLVKKHFTDEVIAEDEGDYIIEDAGEVIACPCCGVKKEIQIRERIPLAQSDFTNGPLDIAPSTGA